MTIRKIALSSLVAHPLNSNVMNDSLLTKLEAHIESTGRYPPIIVRAVPRDNTKGDGPVPRYQILDGHHRVKVLRRLKRRTADCVVWDVDDESAMVLLATLNRLQGRDDPFKRAELLKQLRARMHGELRPLAKRMPEQARDLEAMLALASKPAMPRPARLPDELPMAVHFFLLPGQRRDLDACLKQIGGTREAALMQLVRSANEAPHARESTGFGSQ